jgi:ketose-bisphosphate aldolase
MKLKEIIYDLNKNQAILHYNVSTLEQIKAGILAVKETRIPIIFGVSEGERKYLNPKLVKKIIDFYRDEENLNDFIFLNADHSKTFESSKLALFLNYDEVLVDGSELSLEENIKIVKEIVSLRNENNLNVLIEGEVGFIGGKSEVQKEGVEIKEKDLTNPEDALRFVEETKVDLLAVSIGNIHGILPYEPKLDFERGEKIAKLVKIPLVLHGASGISIENIKKCILIGFKIIHINTEFRKIWKEKLIERLNEDTVAPYKIYEPLVEELKKQIVKYQEEFFSK